MSSEPAREDLEARYEALKALVESDGWKIMTRRSADEWGYVGYGHRMKTALDDLPQGPDRVYELARIAEQVTATKTAIDEIMAWPTQEIDDLHKKLKPEPKSRRPFDALRRQG